MPGALGLLKLSAEIVCFSSMTRASAFRFHFAWSWRNFSTGPFGAAEGLVHLAQTAESVGVESLWTVEHVIVPKGYESKYPYSADGKMPGTEDSPIPDPP